jgi:hypothetical protein
MSITNVFIIFNLLTTAIAGPLAARDTTCSPISMKDDQVLALLPNRKRDKADHGQKVTTCPKKNTLDSSGHCRGIPNVPGAQGCTSYCEMTLSKGYGQEVPFHRGYCQDQTKCTVDTSESVSTTQTWTVEMKSELGTGESVSKALTGGFNIGASYSWSKTLTYTTSTQNQKVLKENQCGYWTYIPYVMEYVLFNAYPAQLLTIQKQILRNSYPGRREIADCWVLRRKHFFLLRYQGKENRCPKLVQQISLQK